MKDIAEIRQSINEIDAQILELLEKRKAVTLEVAEFKFNNGLKVVDKKREQEHLNVLMQNAEKKNVSAELVRKIYLEIYEDSVANQISYLHYLANKNQVLNNDLEVSYLGPIGTYSYHATRKYLNAVKDDIKFNSCSSFNEIISNVEQGKSGIGVLPIENTSSGCINEVYDLLQEAQVKIVGELTFAIKHCIIGKPGLDLSKISTIYSHSQPASQCSIWLRNNFPNAEIKTCSSSSAAIQEVAKLNSDTSVAIGIEDTGKMFGLVSYATNIANQKNNVTRFIVIAKHQVVVPMSCDAKTSLTFTTPNKPGSLVKVLEIFSKNKVNVVKIQSRPRAHNELNDSIWAETFYADVCVNEASAVMQSILSELEQVTGEVKLLGCYLQEQ